MIMDGFGDGFTKFPRKNKQLQLIKQENPKTVFQTLSSCSVFFAFLSLSCGPGSTASDEPVVAYRLIEGAYNVKSDCKAESSEGIGNISGNTFNPFTLFGFPSATMMYPGGAGHRPLVRFSGSRQCEAVLNKREAPSALFVCADWDESNPCTIMIDKI
jgi:hypothetical protein